MTDLKEQGQRLKQFTKAKRMTQVALSQKLSVTPGFVSNMINGKEPITRKIYSKLNNLYPLLNMNWLMKGEGEMFLSEIPIQVNEIEQSYDRTTNGNPEKPLHDLTNLLQYYNDRIENLEKRLSILEGRVGKD